VCDLHRVSRRAVGNDRGRSRAEAAALGAGDVLGVLQADVRPTRMRCVTLPITVLAKALG